MKSVRTRAAVLSAPGESLTIETLELAAPGPGEVRVAVEAAGVCHSDLHYLRGELVSRLPVVPGHEGVGFIEAVGPGVTRLAVGDRVLLTWRPRCGDCAACLAGRPALCAWGRIQAQSGGLPDGTTRLRRTDGTAVHHLMGISCFADRCVVSERAVVPLPHDLPRDVAAVLGCAVTTGVGAVLNVVGRAAGEPVLVIGAGGVGLSVVLGLGLVGAHPIVVTDTVGERVDRAVALGATHGVDVSAVSLEEALGDAAIGPFPWVIDTVGLPTTVESAIGALAPAGTLVLTGLADQAAHARFPINRLVQQDLHIVGSLYGSSNPAVLVPKLVDLYRSGKLDLGLLAGESHPLDEITGAFDALASGALGRALITFE